MHHFKAKIIRIKLAYMHYINISFKYKKINKDLFKLTFLKKNKRNSKNCIYENSFEDN